MTWYQNFLTHCEMIFRSTLTKPLRTPIDCLIVQVTTQCETFTSFTSSFTWICRSLFCFAYAGAQSCQRRSPWADQNVEIVSLKLCQFWSHVHFGSSIFTAAQFMLYFMILLYTSDTWCFLAALVQAWLQLLTNSKRETKFDGVFPHFWETSHTRSLHCRIAIKRKNKTVRQYTASGESCSFCQKETNIFLHPKVLLSLMPLL